MKLVKELVKKFIIISLALVVLAALVLSLVIKPTPPAPDKSMSRMPAPWQGYDTKKSATNASGTFEVKAMEVTPDELLFFYALKSAEKGSLEVRASVTAKEDNAQPQALAVNRVQPLSTWGDMEIGAIHTSWVNRASQVYNLKITKSNAREPVWEVSPLIQLEYDRDKVGAEIFHHFLIFAQDDLPLKVSDWVNMQGGGTEVVGAFKMALDGYPPLYLSVNRQSGAVATLSAYEFKALSAKLTVTPFDSNPPGINMTPTFAPARTTVAVAPNMVITTPSP